MEKEVVRSLKEDLALINQDRIHQAMLAYGIPKDVVDDSVVHFRESGLASHIRLMGSSTTLATYKYFKGVEQPLFYFQDMKYMEQKVEVDQNGIPNPQFRLNMYVHNTPALIVYGEKATPELHDFISRECLTNHTRHPAYAVNKDAGAFFQGGYGDRKGRFIYVEFHLFDGAQAFVDYVNENYPKWYKENICG